MKSYRHIPVEFFNEKIWVNFEFLKVPIPRQFDELLIKYYGESYMTPKQVITGHQKGGKPIFDPERSYLEVLEEYKKETEKP
jgi:lipopolysaccharide cholinephosphotransferase